MNSVQLIGRLTRDPEIRYTSGSQMAVARFTIAIDRPTRAGGERQTDFPSIKVFGKQAETCEKYLAKGRKVAIEGRIETGKYQNKNGDTVYTTEVVANRVEFLDWGDRQQGQGGYDGGQGYGGGNYGNQGYQGGYQGGQGGYNDRGYGQQSAEPAPEMPESFQAIDEDVPF